MKTNKLGTYIKSILVDNVEYLNANDVLEFLKSEKKKWKQEVLKAMPKEVKDNELYSRYNATLVSKNVKKQ